MVGAELQGTATGNQFKGVATGTHDSVFKLDFCEKGQKPEKVFVFESAIDLLSFRQMCAAEKLKGCALVSMAGLKYSAIQPFVDAGIKVLSCVDNDEKGREFNERHGLKASTILAKEGVKDYNDLLKKRNAEQGLTPKPKPAPPQVGAAKPAVLPSTKHGAV